MEPTVTVDKSHFEALIRRAEFHANGSPGLEGPNGVEPGMIAIPQLQYDALCKANREYNVLRKALFRGGLNPKTLQTLIETGDGVADETEEPRVTQSTTWENLFSYPTSVPVTITKPPSEQPIPDNSEPNVGIAGFLSRPRVDCNRSASFATTEPYNPGADDEDDEDDGTESHGGSQAFSRHEKRTLYFAGLPAGTAHKDVVKVLRGGRILDIYLRKDRSATVSFIEGAQEFLKYAKRHDIYIHQKRVEVRWADRQFTLPGHVADKIANGATRNIVIRGGAAKLNEQTIRDDMEHIHNLIILDISVHGADVRVSTNSIRNALFARTCMMSRQSYKGLRVEWYPDECAAPLPKPDLPSYNHTTQPKKMAPKANANLYAALLDMDGNDEGMEQDDDDTIPTGGIAIGINWADNAIAT